MIFTDSIAPLLRTGVSEAFFPVVVVISKSGGEL